MSPFGKLPCWVIMNCAEDKECPAKNHPHQDCWEVFKAIEANTFNSSFNICRDCIVFLSRQKDSPVSSEEMKQIMERKGITVTSCGNYTRHHS
ncbi:MAG: hypothetical protein D6B25_11995 [Desulfobulbaceae bacterium]|nr:MAG: hypothetical protein D6B25_11995 [Desulfobulbaceae bacterium]